MNLETIKTALKENKDNIDAYICSPYRGKTEEALQTNVQAAKQYCRYALTLGYSPICPHLFFTQFLDDTKDTERELGLSLGKRCIDFADVFFVFLNADRTISEGMQGEIEYAQSKGKQIKFVTYTDVAKFLEKEIK